MIRCFLQEELDAAAAKLKAMISVTAAVVRDGQEEEIPLKELVPGDVINLCAGDMVPADIRLIASRDLFIAQAALTGESLPVEKLEARELREGVSPLELANVCFLGTSVESGSATAVVVATGAQTYFGRMASCILGPEITTSFDRGMHRFTVLMIQFILVMVPLVFLINGLTKHNWAEAFFFSIAVAVGLTPEMLPMIVSVCLSNGALAMSKKKVIVKRLNSIQNLGAMDVLCTDKTGTLQFDFRLYYLLCDAVPVRLLGPVPCTGFPDWLVRRIADYANADHPRDSHEENPFSSRPGQLASHDHDGRDYLHWHVAPVLAPGRYFGLHAFATAVLANPFRYPALLRYPYSNRENVADAQVLAINCRNLNVPEATVDAVFRLWYIRKQL